MHSHLTIYMVRAQRTNEFRCPRCGVVCSTKQALGGHLSTGPTCIPANCVRIENTSCMVQHNETSSRHDIEENVTASPSPLRHDVSPLNTCVAESSLPLHRLLQRPCRDSAQHRITPTALRPGSRAHVCNSRNTYKLHEVNRKWSERI